MSYSYKCYSDTKDFMKKFVNAEEGAIIYGIIVSDRKVGNTARRVKFPAGFHYKKARLETWVYLQTDLSY